MLPPPPRRNSGRPGRHNSIAPSWAAFRTVVIFSSPLFSLRRNLITYVFVHPPGAIRSYYYADFQDRGKGNTLSQAKSIFFCATLFAVAPFASSLRPRNQCGSNTRSGRFDQLQGAIVVASPAECKTFFNFFSGGVSSWEPVTNLSPRRGARTCANPSLTF